MSETKKPRFSCADARLEGRIAAVAFISIIIFAVIVIVGEASASHFELYTLHLGPFTIPVPWHSWIYMREGLGIIGFVSVGLVAASVFIPRRRVAIAVAGLLAVTTFAAGALAIGSLAALRPQAHDARDQLLYLLGSKYYDETGYKDLHRCIIEAAGETGVEPPTIYRDQATNAVIDARRSLELSKPCRDQFSEKRWEELKSDLGGFTPALVAWRGQWEATLLDFGFNGTPVLRRFISATSAVFPATHQGLTYYAFLNLAAVMIGLFSVLTWVGWRESLVCALLLFVYAGDSFIHMWSIPRYFWLASILTAVSLMNRGGNKWAWPIAGGLLALSAGLKLFPAVWSVGPALLAGMELLQRKRGDGIRMMIGAAITAAVLFVWSVSDAHHLSNWTEFIERIRMNGNRATTGCIGLIFDFLRPIPGPDLDLRPMQRALDAKLLGPITLHHIQWLVQILLSFAVVRACLRIDYARAAMLSGFGLMFIWFVPVSYYYAGFLGLPLLFPHYRGKVMFAVSSVWLLFSAGMSGMMFERVIEPKLYTLFLSSSFTGYLIVSLLALEIEHRRKKSKLQPKERLSFLRNCPPKNR
jgi:hypothetical protein